MISNI